MGEEFLTWTAGELGTKIRKGEIRPSEAVEASLLQIERMEPQIGAFLQIDRKERLPGQRKWSRVSDPENIRGHLPECRQRSRIISAQKVWKQRVHPGF